MNNSKIFLVDDPSGKLTPLVESRYDTEDLLQRTLEQYPELLLGDQVDSENPRRWLLVKREMAVPDIADGGGRWSLDHLFLDQDGIPTFVECKRSSDPRVRREVVAQMLDYAANAVEYWSMDRLRQSAAETHKDELDSRIGELIEAPDADVDDFWMQVEQNLRLGRLRMLFVADTIPVELRRIVKFLDDKMPDVKVLAVEVKQFLADGRKVLIPHILGQSETSRKSLPTPRQVTNRDTFLDQFNVLIRQFFTHILDEADRRQHTIYWGIKGFSVKVKLPDRNLPTTFAYGFPGGVTTTHPEPVFQTYWAYLDDAGVESQHIRQQISELAGFRKAGKHTVYCLLTEATIPIAERAWALLLAFVAEKQSIGAKSSAVHDAERANHL